MPRNILTNDTQKNEKTQPQVIRRARLFHTEEYFRNIEQIERQAKEIDDQMKA